MGLPRLHAACFYRLLGNRDFDATGKSPLFALPVNFEYGDAVPYAYYVEHWLVNIVVHWGFNLRHKRISLIEDMVFYNIASGKRIRYGIAFLDF